MEYDFFQEEKLKYEDIEIPDELLLMVRQTIAADRRKKAVRQRARIIKMVGSVAAILFLCLTIGVNSSYAFAETVVKIPVVKSVAKAVIVRSYKADIIALDEQGGKQPEQVPDVEQTPEEMPAVSGNDIPSENEETEQPVSQEPSEEPEGLDAWKSDMTLEKFKEVTELYTPEMEERYAQEPEKLRTILLAEAAEKDISLYGYHEDGKITGTALRVKDTYQYFDWIYMNESKKLPEISFVDANGDGEEEIVVLLYNGTIRKKEISKEEVAAPEDTAAKEDAEAAENKKPEQDAAVTDPVKPDTAEKTTDESGITKSDSPAKGVAASDSARQTPAESNKDAAAAVVEEAADNITQDTISGDNLTEGETAVTVSGNDMQAPSAEERNPEPEQPAGELWIISIKEGDWPAALLTPDDCESQILHQLKAEYNEEASSLQLYLMEEALGTPVKLPLEQKLAFEKINLMPERKFTTTGGLCLNFKLEAVFQDESKQKTTCLLPVNLQAGIHLEGGSLIIENIQGK